MKVPALIMAGGKGKRIGLAVEKPLLTFLGKPLIERVVEAVKSAKKISELFIVTSKNTPKTEEKCLKASLRVIRTDGKGFHDDLKQAILKKKLYGPVLTISSDLPTIRGRFIDRVISVYENSKKDAVTVLVPIKKREELKLSISSVYDYEGVDYAISGVNVIDGTKILEDKLDEFAIISEDIDAVLNVNTLEDLDTGQKIAKELERSGILK